MAWEQKNSSEMSESVRTTQLTENDGLRVPARNKRKQNCYTYRTVNPNLTEISPHKLILQKSTASRWKNQKFSPLTALESSRFWSQDVVFTQIKSSCKSQITLTKMCWRISQTPFSRMWVISQHPLTYK